MKRLLLLTAILLTSIDTNAEAFLCITEAVAGVRQGDSITTTARVYTPDNKFIVSDAGGEWTFKPFGGDSSKTLQCTSSQHCGIHVGDPSVIPTDVFYRDDENKFSWVSRLFYNKDNEKGKYEYSEVFIYRGSCESI